jgi:hypothetical protein
MPLCPPQIPLWIGAWWNTGLHGEMLATNRPSHGTVAGTLHVRRTKRYANICCRGIQTAYSWLGRACTLLSVSDEYCVCDKRKLQVFRHELCFSMLTLLAVVAECTCSQQFVNAFHVTNSIPGLESLTVVLWFIWRRRKPMEWTRPTITLTVYLRVLFAAGGGGGSVGSESWCWESHELMFFSIARVTVSSTEQSPASQWDCDWVGRAVPVLSNTKLCCPIDRFPSVLPVLREMCPVHIIFIYLQSNFCCYGPR